MANRRLHLKWALRADTTERDGADIGWLGDGYAM
jgi:hypothetical protein